MQIILMYIILTLGILLSSLGSTYAASDKSENREGAQTHATQHPPHDHHEPDHIKKLDEGIRRKGKDEEKSH